MKSLLLILAATLMTGSAFAAVKYDYFCYSYYWNGHDHERGIMKLKVQDKKASAEIFNDDGELIDRTGGDLDSRYRSRGTVKFVKFGHSLIVEKVLLSGGRKLRDGALGGIARFEGEREGGFFQYKFICKKRGE